MSCMFQLSFISFSAVVADSSSGFGGLLSSLSSVTLKSPNMNSGAATCRFHCSVSTLVQNSGWAFLSLGAYIFSMDVVHDSNHLIWSSRALPGISMCGLISWGFIRVLLIMNATQAFACGLSGWGDTIILRFFSYRACNWSIIVRSRWVSWTARIATFLDLSILLMDLHLVR